MSDADPSEETQPPSDEPIAEAPLLTLRDGLTHVTDTEAGLTEACAALAAGTGPVAVDAERASGYRYSSRAYLIQLRRAGSGTWLVDPVAFDSLAPLAEVLDGVQWVLHAATQDIPSLAAVGLRPHSLFDTELAGRLLGYPRVGLATLVETVLGQRMKKEHSAADWSKRPLPAPWLEYAALDVEPLLELRSALEEQLVAAGKEEWARQEFEHVVSFEATPRVDAWRRTSGLHRIRGRRGLAAVKALWEVRDELAERRDVTPGRILPDSAIVAAAHALPQDRDALLAVPGFHGRGAERYASRWVSALGSVAAMEESQLPTRGPRADGPPLPRAWADRDPVAARRLALAREALGALAEQLELPVENLLTPDHLRRVLWAPPSTREPDALAAAVAAALTEHGDRPWQVELAGPVVTRAILDADQPAPATPDPGPDPDPA